MAKNPNTDSAVESEAGLENAAPLEQPVAIPADSEAVLESAAPLEQPIAVPAESETLPGRDAHFAQPVPVRLLVDSEHGRINAVVYLPQAQAASVVKAGLADNHPQAVAFAFSQAVV